MNKILFLLFLFLIFSCFNCNLSYGQSLQENKPWIGIGSDWRFLNKPTGLSTDQVLDLWEKDIEERMEKYRFNTVRLAFAFSDFENTTRNQLNFEEFERVLDLFDSHGIKVILDLHNFEDMEAYFGSDEWINAWVEVAKRYKDDLRIVAFEIFNEPFGPYQSSRVNTWDSWITGGGSTISDGTEGVSIALAKCVDSIRATGDNHTIIYPDPWWFRPTTDDVFNPKSFVEGNYSRENIMITMHPWFLSDNQTIDFFYDRFLPYQIDKFEAWAEYYDIWLGEFGVFEDYPWIVQKIACVELVNYASSKGVGFNFWISKEILENREDVWDIIEEVIDSSKYTNLLLKEDLLELSEKNDYLQKEFYDMEEEVAILLQEYNELNDEYEQLVNSFNEVSEDNRLINQDYELLATQYFQLREEFEKIEKERNELLSQIENLNSVERNETDYYFLLNIFFILIIIGTLLFYFIKSKKAGLKKSATQI